MNRQIDNEWADRQCKNYIPLPSAGDKNTAGEGENVGHQYFLPPFFSSKD